LLQKNDTAYTVFCKSGSALLAQLHANKPGTLAGKNPEYLHQMRVTVRRLQTLLSAYANLLGKTRYERIDEELKWLGQTIGPARDSDVFVHEIWPPLREQLASNALTAALDAAWLRHQKRDATKAHNALRSPRYQKLLRDLAHGFSARANPDTGAQSISWEQPAKRFARAALEHRSHRVHRYGHDLDMGDDFELHRLRIGIKKLRYTMEAFGSLFKPSRTKELMAALSSLQDILGAIHDIVVATEKVDAVLANRQGIDVTQLRTQMAGWHALRLKTLKRKLKGEWHRYRQTNSI
jgi:triphosphatase